MMNTSRRLILLASMLALPFLGGCFGTSGSNPLGVASVPAEDNALMASGDDAAVAAVSAAKLMTPVTKSNKKYSYAAPPCKVSHTFKAELARLPGSLKVRFCGNSTADSIFLKLGDMKVKAATGKPYVVPLAPQEIDLKAASALTQLLGGLDLPAGSYNYLEFQVKDARVVVAGTSYPVKVPSNRVRFLGQFSIMEGFSTELNIKFFHKLLSEKGPSSGKSKKPSVTYILHPVVKISSSLVAKPLPVEITKGEIAGVVLDYVKKSPVSGLTVTISGSVNQTTTTDAAGAFQFKDLLAGAYTLTLTHTDYLDKSLSMQVLAGQVAEVAAELNPAVIRSTVANTGWFSERYPLADAKGSYGEVALETPVAIDFVSLAFTRVEMTFDSDYHSAGAGRFNAYLSSSQQVQIITNLGGWWVGNNALLGSMLGEFYATNPATHYSLNVTDYVRNNPSAAYYLAARNLSIVDIRLSNIQMTIFYR